MLLAGSPIVIIRTPAALTCIKAARPAIAMLRNMNDEAVNDARRMVKFPEVGADLVESGLVDTIRFTDHAPVIGLKGT